MEEDQSQHTSRGRNIVRPVEVCFERTKLWEERRLLLWKKCCKTSSGRSYLRWVEVNFEGSKFCRKMSLLSGVWLQYSLTCRTSSRSRSKVRLIEQVRGVEEFKGSKSFSTHRSWKVKHFVKVFFERWWASSTCRSYFPSVEVLHEGFSILYILAIKK